MKNEKEQIQELIQKTTILVEKLASENQAYFDDLIAYMGMSSVLREEQTIREQLYQMVLDFADAEKDGLSAQEFLGQNPQAMADELIKNSPRMAGQQMLKIGLLVGVIMTFYRLLSSFSSTTYLRIAPLVYLSDALLGLIVVVGIFYSLAKSVYGNWKNWHIWVASTLLASLGFLLRYLAEVSFGSMLVFPLPYPWDLVLVGLACTAYIFLTRGDVLFQVMLFPIGGMVLVGFLKRWTESAQMTDPLWTVVFPILIIVLSLMIFYYLAYYYTVKKHQ